MKLSVKYRIAYWVGTALICSLAALLIATSSMAATGNPAENANIQAQLPPVPTETGPIVSNDSCLGCHGNPGLTMKLENGDVLDLYVDPETYASSIHGKDGYACVQCHTNLGDYPHPTFTATDLRDVTLKLTGVCDRCHSGQYNLTMDSVHAAAQAQGVRQAAVCSDCHGSHNVQQWTDPKTGQVLQQQRSNIPLTCAKCHNAIYQKYSTSVHGTALMVESNPDVPTCIDCHGVHNIGNPTTAAFRLKSPELCAGCHTNPALMDKYGISTNVLNTYVADFHGTTVTLFEKQSPDSPTNKPVCYDCHGVHDISNVDNPSTGIAMQQNLLVRCKVCHPDATANFPTAWMEHYIPSPSHFAAVYYVNLFYKLFIPGVLGFMVILVGLDVGHSLYIKNWRRKRREKVASAGEPAATPDPAAVKPEQEASTQPGELKENNQDMEPKDQNLPDEPSHSQGGDGQANEEENLG